MSVLPSARSARRLAAALTVVATMVSVFISTPAQAFWNGAAWYMIKSEVYQKCLSTNEVTSPAGGVTHRVYLAGCNEDTRQQWWYISKLNDTRIVNLTEFDDYDWELSANNDHAFTARVSSSAYHVWDFRLVDGNKPNRFRIQNTVTTEDLSSSQYNPYSEGIYKVYPAGQDASTNTHWWNLIHEIYGQ